MIKILTAGFCTLLYLVIPDAAQAQVAERCSFIRNEQLRQLRNPRKETTAQFEAWMQSRLAQSGSAPPTIAATYTIPVVVHIIHNGINDVTNISDAQVLSQINVLNEDFKRLNSDAGNTPLEFLGVAGSIDIQFVLAARDPEGLPTNGIVRVQATKSGWTLDDQSEMKALSYWPAEQYLNIWVINFTTNDIGYAQFPVSPLAGLEDASTDRLTDGVVIDYTTFGSIDDGAFPLQARFNKGRTATHEIGHFLGLRHLWGDVSGCGDDFVNDTPTQTGPTSFCPPVPQQSCSHNKMFMNYMDYTDDGCMNLFTVLQASRMVAVLTASPRRLSLLTSPGTTPPTPVANDLGIRKVIAPTAVTCITSPSPQIEVRNYGTNAITTAQVTLSINHSPVQTKGLPSSLALLAQANIVFDPVVVADGTLVEFTITSVNGGGDGLASNNEASVGISIPPATSLPMNETFFSSPSPSWGSWAILNPDGQSTWNQTSTGLSTGPMTIGSMTIRFYDYENEGVNDWLITPSLQVTTPATALLRFDISYAQYPGETGDGLKVYALRGCNRDLSQAILLFDKSDVALSTATATSISFVPASQSQWRTEVISLSSLDTSVPWQLAFVTRNGYGNNLYLDNVIASENEVFDIALEGVSSPGIVHCLTTPSFKFTVRNLGTSPITGFKVGCTVNSVSVQNITYPIGSLDIPVGESMDFTLKPVNLNSGVNEVKITLLQPNGIPDIAGNNEIVINSVVDQSVDKGPLRMTFDNPQEISWRVASPGNADAWEAVSTNKDQSISYRSFTNPSIGEESWLVSPNLDLRSGAFSLFFDVSYAQNVPADDRLQILASTDCGVTYSQVLLDRAASTFTPNSSSDEWEPVTNDDWSKEYVDLSSLAGLKNVRLAFVAKNDNGNNLYIDNIELFEGNDPNPPVTSVPYQLYYSTQNSQSDIALTFHLAMRQDVQLQIIGLQGNVVREYLLPDTFNQTYYFDLSGQAAGLYLFRMIIDNNPAVTKVFIGH